MAIPRRHFLLGSLAVSLAGQKKREAARPNVVFIVTDDLAAWMLGCYGNKEIRTPNIDRLARTGTRFLHSYCCTPIRAASTATLLTGRVPRQHGLLDYLTDKPVDNPPQGQAALPASFQSEVMLSDLLAAQGYQCGFAGRWSLGNERQPQHHFDFWYTMAGGNRYQDPEMVWNGEVVKEKGYLADLITARAGQFLDRQTGAKPFFLTLGYLNPHTPYEGHPQKYYDLYAKSNFETIGWQPAAPNALREKEFLKDTVGNIRKCAAATTALDDQVAVLVNKLQERKLLDNTLVVFAGNDGFLLGRHGLWSNGMASHPSNMYEEVMQVPLIWSWPGKVAADNTRPELVSAYDLLPSVCEAVDMAPPSDRNLCGRSYYPLACNKPLPKKEPWRNEVFGHLRNTGMARDARYKLILRDGGQGPNELYDLGTDPRERVNQYDNEQFIGTRDRLTQDLAAWRKKYGGA